VSLPRENRTGRESAGVREAEPLVSVVVAAFNAERTIAQAIDSVVAQSFPDWELLVCDDASSDSTPAIVESRLQAYGAGRCRLLSLPHAGPAASRNSGIRDARGEYIAFLDDDDFWTADKLSRCVEVARAESADIVCHSELWLQDDGSSEVHHYSELFDVDLHPAVSLFRNNPFSTSALLVRRRCLLDAGLFDVSLPSAEDYDLWIRLAMLPGIRVRFLDEPLGVYRIRSGSESSKIDRRLRALRTIGEKYGTHVRSLSRRGPLEQWMFLAKTYVTTGIRYLAQGSALQGIGLLGAGLVMWPFRFDLLRHAVKRASRRRPRQITVAAPAGR
jgi:glycosyltransferase involved in cell wall biosynthesis